MQNPIKGIMQKRAYNKALTEAYTTKDVEDKKALDRKKAFTEYRIARLLSVQKANNYSDDWAGHNEIAEHRAFLESIQG